MPPRGQQGSGGGRGGGSSGGSAQRGGGRGRGDQPGRGRGSAAAGSSSAPPGSGARVSTSRQAQVGQGGMGVCDMHGVCMAAAALASPSLAPPSSNLVSPGPLRTPPSPLADGTSICCQSGWPCRHRSGMAHTCTFLPPHPRPLSDLLFHACALQPGHAGGRRHRGIDAPLLTAYIQRCTTGTDCWSWWSSTAAALTRCMHPLRFTRPAVYTPQGWACSPGS
jgi:hypothetical protein